MVLFATNIQILNAVVFNCTFEMYTHSYIGTVYHCAAQILLDGQNDTLAAVYGTHQSDKGHIDVKQLFAQYQGLQFFPRNIESFFPNLIAIRFAANQISHISNEHLVPFPNLVWLSFWSNRVTSLDSNLFAGLPSIRYINFSTNNIKHVGHDIILPETGEIRFGFNTCIDKSALTPNDIIFLRFSLLVNCPPTISQIEATLESRPNLITNVYREVKDLAQSHIDMQFEISHLKQRVEQLESFMQIQLGLK